jgi:hypothetical protein
LVLPHYLCPLDYELAPLADLGTISKLTNLLDVSLGLLLGQTFLVKVKLIVHALAAGSCVGGCKGALILWLKVVALLEKS